VIHSRHARKALHGNEARIYRAARLVVAEQTWQQMLIDAGMEPMPDSGPEQFRRSLAADVALWAPVVKALGVNLD
jgi:tripartite-type tricarboxylate transporter receptor subunit TctC